ncbi:MAG: 16S rRNA (cytidine(1402)-2'-O)-methyltransferase [Elusimicrobiota bacterium]
MLYIISTPIGNFKDITFRALEAIKDCDCIFCENTSQTLKLLTHYGISKPIFHYNDHNLKCVEKIRNFLDNGKKVALISDGGMPNISDPGFMAIRYARERGIKVEIFGGPTAVINAVAGSGFDASNFVFLGFLPRSDSKLLRKLEKAFLLNCPVIVYESPNRVVSLLKFVMEKIGDIEVCVMREMTKIYEECFWGNISEVLRKLKSKDIIKGEITIVFKKDLKVIETNVKKIGFVCTGNTCRSVMAHYYAEAKAKEMGIKISISSAGIMAADKNYTCDMTIKILEKEGIKFSHFPRQIDRDFIESNDMIFVMTRKHMEVLNALFPEYSFKIFLLLQYAGFGNSDIYDPFGKPYYEYELVFKQIKKSVDFILEKMLKKT